MKCTQMRVRVEKVDVLGWTKSREWLLREDASSPMALLEDFFTETIDTYERQDIMSLGVLNAFIHTNMTQNKDGEERLIIRITVVLVDMLVELDIEMYRKHVVFENGNKVIYVLVEINLWNYCSSAIIM